MASLEMTNPVESTDLVFVVGIPRSGTTLVQCILGASPEVYTLPETHFYSTLLPKLNSRPWKLLNLCQLAEALSWLSDVMQLRLNEEELRTLERTAAAGQLRGRDLFDMILEHYRPAEDYEKRLTPLEKTPLHVEWVRELRDLYPRARFIHVIRDPRDAISSVLQAPFVVTHCLAWHAQRWSLINSHLHTYLHSARDVIYQVKYEDLTERPELTTKSICGFLGLAYDPRMLVDFPDEARRVVLSSERTWKSNSVSGSIRSNHGVWANRLSAKDVWLIERYTWRSMMDFGYQRQAHPGPWSRALWLAQARRSLRRDYTAFHLCLELAKQSAEWGNTQGAMKLCTDLILCDPARLRNSALRKSLIATLTMVVRQQHTTQLR